MNAKFKSNKQGFTLVELIVILVILAVLAAILIPALLGFIDRSREEEYLLRARNIVLAAQTAATREYALGTFDSDGSIFITKNETEIQKMASESGEGSIIRIRFRKNTSALRGWDPVIAALTYQFTENISVDYDINKAPVYHLNRNGGNSTAPGAPTHSFDFKDFLEEAVARGDLNNINLTTPKLQELLMAANGGKLPALTQDEKDLFKTIAGLNAPSQSAIDGYRWSIKEMTSAGNLTIDGQSRGYVLALTAPDSNGNYSSGANTNMVYYNGHYYMAVGKSNSTGKLKTDSLPVQHTDDINIFVNAPTIDKVNWDDVPTISATNKDKKTWIKVS